MIHDSAPWKDALARDAGLIDRWAKKSGLSDRRSLIIEQKVFVAAYAMRKMAEAGKLSTSFNNFTVLCEASPLIKGQHIDRYNAHQFLKLYDLESMTRKAIAAPVLLDILIHSLLFSEALDEDDLVMGFFVTSERQKSTVWLVPLDSFTKLMRHVAEDYPSQARVVRNPLTGEYMEWKGHGEPPPEIQAKMDRIVQSNRTPNSGS